MKNKNLNHLKMDEENMMNINRSLFYPRNNPTIYDFIVLNDAESIRELIQNEGINCLYYRNEHNQTPVHYASYYGYDEALLTMLELGGTALIDQDALLCCAMNYDDFDATLKILLDAGGYRIINNAIPQDDNNTLLHRFAKMGKLNCLKLLLEYGADVFAQNDKGETPRDVIACHYDTFLTDVLDKYENFVMKEPDVN